MINPKHMDVIEWADAIILSVVDAWSYGRLDNPDEWQAWGTAFIRADKFVQQNPPDPYEFDDWRDWAERMFPYFQDAK
jgi:hypothetical protein